MAIEKSHLPVQGAPASGPPLNGWKEIAAHFGRGVRTVQRWEQELALPVHRLPGPRGETVFAFPSELNAWRETVERPAANGNASVLPGDSEPVSPGAAAPGAQPESPQPLAPSIRRFSRRLVLASMSLVAVVAMFAVAMATGLLPGRDAWRAAPGRPVGPVLGEVHGNALVTYDEQGAVLWSHRFPDALTPAHYLQRSPSDRLLALADLDGDGRVETLFFAIHPAPHPSRFYCFESDGRIRFSRTLESRHRYGSEIFTSPWRGYRLLADNATLRAGEIWITWIHGIEFPSVLQRLDARGNVLGEFWNAGYITTVVPVVRAQRRQMLVGGTNNEWQTAFVAILDATRLSGNSPGINSKYMCADCPTGTPEHYLLFPRLDSDAAQGITSSVSRIEPDAEGQVMVGVQHGAGEREGCLYYRFDQDLTLLRAEQSPEYLVIRRELELQPRLLRDAGAADPRRSSVVRSWDGSGFAPVPAARPR